MSVTNTYGSGKNGDLDWKQIIKEKFILKNILHN